MAVSPLEELISDVSYALRALIPLANDPHVRKMLFERRREFSLLGKRMLRLGPTPEFDSKKVEKEIRSIIKLSEAIQSDPKRIKDVIKAAASTAQTLDRLLKQTKP